MPEGQISLPAVPAVTPGLPESFHPVTIEQFSTLNTKPPRPAISEAELYWCDGFMPIGPSNLVTLPGTGTAIFTAPGTTTVVWFGFGNLAATSYCVVLLSDGSLQWVNVLTAATGQIVAAGTIVNPSTFMGFGQWGSQYLIFAKDQDNGYWLWDGNVVYTAGTIAPDISITDPGSNYTSSPSFTVQTTGVGGGVSLSFTLDNGELTQITAGSPGAGFGVTDFINVSLQGGGTDYTAVLTPNLSGTSGGVGQVIVINGGSGYSAATLVQCTNISGASFAPVIQAGVIQSVAVLNPGTGGTVPPTFSITDPGFPGAGIHGGTGASVTGTLAAGQVVSIGVTNGGSGYVSPPTLTIIGDGTGATATALISAGVVTGVQMVNYGTGYTKALVRVTGGNNAGEITVRLMPFGVSGTSIETNQGIVWVANGAASATTPPRNRVLFSSAGSPSDFSTTGGGFLSTDSFLRIGYYCLKQTNGFLYLIGDSSVNYISGVQTTASTGVTSVATTTFSNLNVDPQLGTPWPSSVQVFSRNIVFANTVGVFVSYGGSITKVSLPLDGFYASGPIFGAQSNFPSAVATIFGIPVYMLFLPVMDLYTKQIVQKLLMWDGKKWWTSPQDKNLIYIGSLEINSVFTAYGTDGTNIFPLFNTPTTGFTKVLQSKLFAEPAYYTTKTGIRLHGIVQVNTVDQPLSVFVDNEAGVGSGNASASISLVGNSIIWTNNVGATIAWTNNASQPIVWGTPGLQVIGPQPIAQAGRLLGLTAQTTASNVAILSLGLSEQVYATNV